MDVVYSYHTRKDENISLPVRKKEGDSLKPYFWAFGICLLVLCFHLSLFSIIFLGIWNRNTSKFLEIPNLRFPSILRFSIYIFIQITH